MRTQFGIDWNGWVAQMLEDSNAKSAATVKVGTCQKCKKRIRTPDPIVVADALISAGERRPSRLIEIDGRAAYRFSGSGNVRLSLCWSCHKERAK